ncbi:MAG: serpin family protein [Gemmatimonadota bacterium]
MRMARPSRSLSRNPLNSSVRLGALLAFTAFMGACDLGTSPGDGDGDAPPPITELPRSLSVAELGILEAANVFGFDLLRQVRAAEPRENVFLSPLSASMALGMTANGAHGETLSEMRQALRFGDLPEQEVNRAYRELIDLLRDLDPAVDFHVGNSIWHRQGWEPEAPFQEMNREYFDATVQGLDFSDPAAVTTINNWVHEATQGRIPSIVESPIDPRTVLFLINAIDFDGKWTRGFDPAATRSHTFRNHDGTEGTVQLMTRRGEVRIGVTTGADVMELPYGGDAFVMTVVIPRGDRSVDALVESLDAEGWASLVGSLHPTDALVGLPRFTMEWERTLNDDLQALGMERAFVPHLADFTRMFSDALEWQVHIHNVKQKSFVEVDEVGTRASAATSVEVGVVSAPPTVFADRPFLFAIRERLSGTILFLGVMVEAPEA